VYRAPALSRASEEKVVAAGGGEGMLAAAPAHSAAAAVVFVVVRDDAVGDVEGVNDRREDVFKGDLKKGIHVETKIIDCQ
jgi:hypothetical protein